MKKKMKRMFKKLMALLMVFSGSMAIHYYLTEPVSYSAMFTGLGGVMLLYPAVIAYGNMFDNLFGE